MSYSFREKVLDPAKRVMIYEVVPPEPHTTAMALKRSASTLVKTLKGFEDVDAIYIPEVIDESERGSTIVRPLKVPARRFASFVRNSYDNEDIRKQLIISHPFSYTPKGKTEDWLKETYNEAGIEDIIIVGPRHGRKDLPGYSVTETAKLISGMNEKKEANIFAGGICIDSRRKSSKANPSIDEHERMARKAKCGVMYFVNQICYDSESAIRLLQDYKNECERHELEPRRVFIGASPVSSESTLKVIEALMEKSIDTELKAHIFSKKYGIGNRSIQRIEEMFRRIFDYCYGENLGVPLGVCVEYVTDSNFRYALELLDSLPELWKEYHPDSEFSRPNDRY